MKIIGYRSQLPNVLSDSEGKTLRFETIRQALDFFFERYMEGSEPKTYRVCWDIDQTVAPILRLLPKELALQLHKTAHCRLVYPSSQGSIVYALWYVRKKGFSVRNLGTGQEGILFHLSQFFPPEVPEPSDFIELEAYTRTLFAAYQKMGFWPQNLYSPISILHDYLLRMDIPTYKDIPREVSEVAIECGNKVWHEAHMVGHWDRAYDYDLRSAFAWVLSQCPDVRFGDWVRSKERLPQAMYYGFCRCKVEITSQISPIIYKPDGQEGDKSPVGTWPDSVTMVEIDTVNRWKLGNMDIKDGWWWVPRDKVRKPLMTIVQRLQNARKQDRLTDWNAKGMLVGLYGYSGQERANTLGDFNNPVIFAQATALTRCNLANFIFQHKLPPILIATDGVLSPKRVRLTDEDIHNGWKLSHAGEALVISTGVSYLGTKRPLGLDLEVVKALIQSDPGKSYWETKRRRLLTLGEAVEWDCLNKVGEMADFRITVDLNSVDRDRKFRRYPKTGTQLLAKQYTSKAFEVKDG
jgi:hypothetical protein